MSRPARKRKRAKSVRRWSAKHWAADDLIQEARAFVNAVSKDPSKDNVRRLRAMVLASRGAKTSFDLEVIMWKLVRVVDAYKDVCEADAKKYIVNALAHEFDGARVSKKTGEVIDAGHELAKVGRKLGPYDLEFLAEHAPAVGAAFIVLCAGLARVTDPVPHHKAKGEDFEDTLHDLARDVRKAVKKIDSRSE